MRRARRALIRSCVMRGHSRRKGQQWLVMLLPSRTRPLSDQPLYLINSAMKKRRSVKCSPPPGELPSMIKIFPNMARHPRECCGSAGVFHKRECQSDEAVTHRIKRAEGGTKAVFDNPTQPQTPRESGDSALLKRVAELERRDEDNQKKLEMLYAVADKGRLFKYGSGAAEKKHLQLF